MAKTINDVRSKLSDKNRRRVERNAKYWSERMANASESTYADSEACVELAKKNYEKASAQMTKDIESWYSRIVKNNDVSLSEARQMLDKDELADFKMSLEEYIEKGKKNLDDKFTKELENASAKVHIRKDEALQLELRNTVENLYGKTQEEIQKSLGSTYESSFYHTAYELDMNSTIDASVVGTNKRAIAKAIEEPWRVDSTKWSDNVWDNKETLVQNIQTHLTQGLMRGDHPDKVAKEISKLMDTDYKKTARLVRTETAAILNKAQLDCYKDLGMDQIQITETLDSTTCDLCGMFDGTVIDQKEAVEGVTIPPFHPNCRGCTAPYDVDWLDENDTRIARDEDGNQYYVPADMTYEEWKARFVDGTKSNDDLLKTTDSFGGTAYLPKQQEKEKAELTSEGLGSAFNSRSEKKNTDVICDYVNARDNADPTAVNVLNNMGNKEDRENLKIVHSEKSGTFDLEHRVDGRDRYVDSKLNIPKLSKDDEYLDAKINTAIHEELHNADFVCRTDEKGWKSYTQEGTSDLSSYVSQTAIGRGNTGNEFLDTVATAERPTLDGISDEARNLFEGHTQYVKDLEKQLSDKYGSTYNDLNAKLSSGEIDRKEYAKQWNATAAQHNSDYLWGGRSYNGGGVDLIEDIYDGMTNGRLYDNNLVVEGHGGRFFRQDGVKEAEILANYGTLKITHPELIDVLKKDFPDLCDACDSTLASMFERLTG